MSMNVTHAPDVALAVTLNERAKEHEEAAARCYRERRQVWLRLFENGMPYSHLQEITGFGSTTLWKHLARARKERDET